MVVILLLTTYFSVISINGNIMQLSSPSSAGPPTVTQTATTVAQAVPHNQQNIVMVILILYNQIFLSDYTPLRIFAASPILIQFSPICTVFYAYSLTTTLIKIYIDSSNIVSVSLLVLFCLLSLWLF